ncbi:MAG: hypothetical protein ACOC1S_02635 [bacterium]
MDNLQEDEKQAHSHKEYLKAEKMALSFGILGAILLVGGIFLPFVTGPEIGQLSYFDWGVFASIAYIILAIFSLIFIYARIFKALWVSSVISLLIVSYMTITTKLGLSGLEIKVRRMVEELEPEEIEEIVNSLELQFGSLIIILGAVLLMISAFIAPSK